MGEVASVVKSLSCTLAKNSHSWLNVTALLRVLFALVAFAGGGLRVSAVAVLGPTLRPPS